MDFKLRFNFYVFFGEFILHGKPYRRLMSYIEFRPKCLPSDVVVVISKQLAFLLREGGGRKKFRKPSSQAC